MIDLLINGGQVVDGSGSPGFEAAVAVTGDTVTILRGDVSAVEAVRRIDAAGLVVCPGFIDLHSHAGLTILGEPHHEPKVRQGVTTELFGIDGISHSPFRTREELERSIWLDSGLNGEPPAADWLTTADLYNRYDGTVAINVAVIQGNNPLRVWAVGWDDRPATNAEIADMAAVLRESMEEGAWGLSTGLDYPPGSYASTEELITLSEAAARMGGFYHTHTRYSLAVRGGHMAPFQEAIDIGRRSGCPVHLTHYRQAVQGLGSHLDYIGLVEDARAEGMDVTFDCYSYPYSGTTLVILLPQWTRSGGPEALMARLRNPAERARIRKGADDSPWGDRLWAENWLTNFRRPENKRFEGHSIAEIAELRGQEPLEAMCDLLLEENLGICTIALGTNAHTLPAFVSHPYGMIASDAILFGEWPNPRSYGCFPLVLAEFVRAERHLRLPEAIRKMTSFPAQRLGIPDRGLLRDGFRADIVCFDPATVKAPATKADPKQYPIGIEYVIVNGQVVIERGENTGALPGRALRRGRART
ncbi:MAG: D-aminoacylase [Chloroflexi bacterium]|nr:D-aminoacylase [Chloroflexota bacterium]